MTAREKKMLVVLIVACIGFGVDQILQRMDKAETRQNGTSMLQAAQQVVLDSSAATASLPLQSAQLYTLEASQRGITKNPFQPERIVIQDQQSSAVSGTANVPILEYTGFIQIGSNVLAIISGMEYAVGDTIPMSGDVVRAVSPGRVTLYSASRKAEWELTYSGDEF